MSEENKKPEETVPEEQNEQKEAQNKSSAPDSDEDITIYEEAVSIDRSRQKSNRVFVFYIISLFCVALVLILISYVMQVHTNDKLEDLNTQLTEQTDTATGAQAKAEQLQETIDSMQQQLDEANAEKETLTGTVDEQTKSIEALNSLWQLERAYQEGDSDTALALIEEMDAAYTREVLTDTATAPLTDDAATEYSDICDALGA